MTKVIRKEQQQVAEETPMGYELGEAVREAQDALRPIVAVVSAVVSLLMPFTPLICTISTVAAAFKIASGLQTQ